jgi:ornithine cyclodeaminase/alanine dehydrogenase-like protein (mu-crystallin family)
MRTYDIIKDRKIRMALVGCGRIAANHFGAMEQHAQDIEVVDVCDVDPAALEKAVARTGAKGHAGLTQMLASTSADVVVLTSPPDLGAGPVHMVDYIPCIHLQLIQPRACDAPRDWMEPDEIAGAERVLAGLDSGGSAVSR